MRMIFLLLLLLHFGGMGSFGQTKKVLDTKIEKVTLYREGAQVERTYRGLISKGKLLLVLENISPEVDKQSIQVQTDTTVVVYSVLHQLNFLREQMKSNEITQWEEEKLVLEEKIAFEKNLQAVLDQEQTMLAKNQSIGGNLGVKTTDLKEATDFHRQRLTEIFQKKQESQKRIRAYEKDRAQLIRQLYEWNQKADRSTSEIQVSVDSKTNTPVTITVRYLVRKAGWNPNYDIRVKDITHPVDLQYKAQVYQQSGEDWKDIKLFLSTGNPNEKGDRPEIQPWYLRFGYYATPRANQLSAPISAGTISGRVTDEKGKPVSYASIVIKGTQTGTYTDQAGYFRLESNQPSVMLSVSAIGYTPREMTASKGTVVNVTIVSSENKLEEVVVVGYGVQTRMETTGSVSNFKRKQDKNVIETEITYQPTSVTYEIKEPYSIPTDGKTYTVAIDAYELEASYEYYAAPRLEPDVYLTANILDWQDLNLQPGEMNLFFENNYLGQSYLDVLNASDTLKLSLGRDKGVVVKRSLVKEFSSKKFLGANKTDTRLYEIIVRNNKSQPIHIIIGDQFPISTGKDIEIRDKNYEGASLIEDTQKLTWTLDLGSKEEKKLRMGYEVRYPKDRVLVLD